MPTALRGHRSRSADLNSLVPWSSAANYEGINVDPLGIDLDSLAVIVRY
jgi:hypothetical protein